MRLSEGKSPIDPTKQTHPQRESEIQKIYFLVQKINWVNEGTVLRVIGINRNQKRIKLLKGQLQQIIQEKSSIQLQAKNIFAMYNPRSRNKKVTSPFPFPSYVVKSYNTETPQHLKGLTINSHKIQKELHSEGKLPSQGTKQRDHSQKHMSRVNLSSQALDKMQSLVGSSNITENKQRRQQQKEFTHKMIDLKMLKPSELAQEIITAHIEAKKEDLETMTAKIENSLTSLNVPQNRKNLYRTRQHKNKSSSPTKSLLVQSPFIIASYRYAQISLYSLLNRKDDYFNSLKNRQVESLYPSLKSSQIEELLKKYVETKGRDKGRIKFNYLTSEQLRSIRYKGSKSYNSSGSTKKQKKQRVQDEDEYSEEENEAGEEKPASMDYPSWKRKNGVGQNQKVFIIKGGYAELRRTLTEKGWYENDDVWSPYFDFKWTTKAFDIDYMSLRPHQSVNHFNNNHHLTSKYGLTRRLKTLYLHHKIDIDRFYPRCFDLGDVVDFQNFIEDFKFGFAETVCKRFLVDKKRYEKRELKVRLAYGILKRRTQSFKSLVYDINKSVIHLIKPEEWSILTETAEFPDQQLEQKLKQMRRQQENDVPSSIDKLRELSSMKEDQIQQLSQQQLHQRLTYEIIHTKIETEFKKLSKSDPQFEMNGFRNVWITKPNFLSRGRGIRCYNNLYDIMTYCCGGSGQFVVQKYIENPLLIDAKKFDIRQWVYVQDYNPPKIWFYDECYIRFCADDYTLDNISNRFQHLTNNSVQKFNKKNMLDKSMWTKAEFIEFVGEEEWLRIEEKIKNIVVWTIRSCEGFVNGRKGNCELVGYDFMIDENLDPWLIEINMSPSMETSTPVTKKLVKMVLHDTGRLIASTKKHTEIGGFKCIYRGNEDVKNFEHYKIS